MNYAKKILVTVFILYLAVLAGGFFLPKTSVVSRSIDIDATQGLVFELVSNHKDFRRWSPWAKKDPTMSVNYDGPEKGVGSIARWSSAHPEVGTGHAEYTEYEPFRMVRMKLAFEQGGGDAVFKLDALSAEQTRVEWLFETENSNVFGRFISFFLLEGLIGPDYEQGLQDLKALAESVPAIKTTEVEYSYNGTSLTGFLATPLGRPEAPIVLVVHEWWGHNAYARKRAAMLAELGYNAFALDMYGDGKLATHPKDAMAFMQEATANMDVLAGRFDAAVAYLKAKPELRESPVAAIGYCFGGSVVLNMSRSGRDLAGVVSFHGGLSSLLPIQSDISAPALVLNGAADPFVKAEHIDAFKQQMNDASAPYTFINYAGAKHSFTSSDATERGEKFGLPFEYSAEADAASWKAMQNFLASVFDG